MPTEQDKIHNQRIDWLIANCYEWDLWLDKAAYYEANRFIELLADKMVAAGLGNKARFERHYLYQLLKEAQRRMGKQHSWA